MEDDDGLKHDVSTPVEINLSPGINLSSFVPHVPQKYKSECSGLVKFYS